LGALSWHSLRCTGNGAVVPLVQRWLRPRVVLPPFYGHRRRALLRRTIAPRSTAVPFRLRPEDATGADRLALEPHRDDAADHAARRGARDPCWGCGRVRGARAAALLAGGAAAVLQDGLRPRQAPDPCRNQGGLAFCQLALQRLLPALGHAAGCPELRPASANQPLSPRWPVIPGVLSTQAPDPLDLRAVLPPRVHRALHGARGGAVRRLTNTYLAYCA